MEGKMPDTESQGVETTVDTATRPCWTTPVLEVFEVNVSIKSGGTASSDLTSNSPS